METNYNKREKKQKKVERRSAFWEFMGGDFLLYKRVVRFYPYLLFLFLLMVLIVFNEKWIDKKEKEVRELDSKYKKTITILKENNKFIPYEEDKVLIQMLEEKGFQINAKSLYKIPAMEKSTNKK